VKRDILLNMELLCGHKLLQLLASLLYFCPPGMEKTSMFQYMFLQRLPCTLRTMLGEQEPGGIRCILARADRLWASYKQQANDLVANVEVAEEQPVQQIAAV
jgi:hypothetical protein